MALKDRSRTDEKRIDAVILKGGSAAVTDADEQPQNVQLRLLPSLLARVDAIRNRKPKEIRQSRHAWIMEAILNKLTKEE